MGKSQLRRKAAVDYKQRRWPTTAPRGHPENPTSGRKIAILWKGSGPNHADYPLIYSASVYPRKKSNGRWRGTVLLLFYNAP